MTEYTIKLFIVFQHYVAYRVHGEYPSRSLITKSSRGLKSGDLGGHGIGPLWKPHLPA